MQIKLLNPPTILSASRVLTSTSTLSSSEFLLLYDELFPRVYNYIRYRCGEAAIADDLTSTTFERALLHLECFDARRGVFGAWLFAIARNVVNNYLRSECQGHCLPLETCNDQADWRPTPEERLIQDETQTELLAALACLNERERDLLSLKFAAHFTNRHIAEITNLGESHVSVIIFRALHKLRKILR